MLQPAPFYNDVALGPDNVQARWATASDGTRLRLAIWPEGTKGTVFLFPGRTEYVEKYGRAAADLVARGYAVISIDWRGQGLADRLLDDRNSGHIIHFSDYQLDVAEMLKAAGAQGLPKPYFLLAHSMGGCIGLRSLMNGLDVQAAMFSAPMWGIAISSMMRPLAWTVSWAARNSWFGHLYAPGTSPQTYVQEAPFEDNMLTTAADMYSYMQKQLAEHPELALGGPSLHWLYEALVETRNMARKPAPSVPVLTFLGSNERIVDTAPIHIRMNGWPGGRMDMVEGAEHEVMMEVPAIRDHVFDKTAAFFQAHS